MNEITSARAQERVLWPDAARGLGIILVVLGHVIAGLLNVGVLDHTPAAHWIYFVIYTFHMPLFFVLSGLFLRDGVKRGVEDFLVGKAWTLIVPYFLWSWTQGVLQMAMAGVLDEPRSIDALVSIGWQPISQFWFLYALLLCHLAGLALRTRPLLLLALAVAGSIGASFLPWTNIIAKTLHFLPYYAIGALASRRALNWRAPPVWVTGALLACFAASAALAGGVTQFRAESLMTTPAALFGVASAFALALSAEAVLGLRRLGRASMTILVLHILVIVSLRMVLLGAGVDEPAPHLILGLGLGLLLPAFAHVALEQWNLLPLLGLARPRRKPVEAPASA
ncbi:MAG: acyltransferase family protein [Pseudomonadota bacterium]